MDPWLPRASRSADPSAHNGFRSDWYRRESTIIELVPTARRIDMFEGWGVALGAILGWTAKELTLRLFDRGFARMGRIGIVEGHTRIICDRDSRDGHTYPVDFISQVEALAHYADCRRFRVVFDTQISNDTDTQVVFTRFDFEFWGVEGLRMQHHGEQALIPAEDPEEWQLATAVTVPAHSVARVRFELWVGSTFAAAQRNIQDCYGESVVLLKMQSIDGNSASFRLCTRSFAGSNSVVWPSDKKYPVFNMRSLNQDG
jgi:hypothetical protein